MNNDELTESCKKVASMIDWLTIHPNDLSERELIVELQIARDHFEFQSTNFPYATMYTININDLISVMTNIEILLRIYLFMFCSNFNDERSLEQLGVRGEILKFFDSYINNREQVVQINNTLSDFNKTEFGVVQGSKLGPLLFLIYINDLIIFSMSN